MLKFTKVKIISICLLVPLIILIWPIYDSLVHKNKISFLPFYQFDELPKTSPTDQILYQERYEQAANKALDLITAHKVVINAPAISAAVAIDGKLVWAGASGWADIENETPVTTNTQFRIGSTSKALTATGLARIFDDNKIDLDKKISFYMKNLPNDNWENITSRQLVSHMAGLPHYKQNNDYLGLYKTITLSNRYEQVEDSLAIFDSSDLLFEPGSQFNYSTLGTVLLSAVMESAVNTPYLEFMKKQVFDPLKMNATMAEFQGENAKNLAKFYWNNSGSSNQVREWRNVDLSHRLAGGGYISTSSDLVKMGSAFLDNKFVSAKTRKIFWTPQTLPDGSETPNGYSLGWRVLTRNIDPEVGEITFANHGGVSRGAQSWLMVIPKHNISVAVNINSNTKVFWDFGKVSMEVLRPFLLAKISMDQKVLITQSNTLLGN
jgi:serine beta-lactamase-like protein LACTB, mitochondrial